MAEVVEGESPVHPAEVAKRLSNAAGLSKVGSRIRTAVEDACEYAVRTGPIIRRGEFLWSKDDRPLRVRNRSRLRASLWKIELIVPEEITAAIEQVVASSLGIARDDVPAQVLKLFGFYVPLTNRRWQ